MRKDSLFKVPKGVQIGERPTPPSQTIPKIHTRYEKLEQIPGNRRANGLMKLPPKPTLEPVNINRGSHLPSAPSEAASPIPANPLSDQLGDSQDTSLFLDGQAGSEEKDDEDDDEEDGEDDDEAGENGEDGEDGEEPAEAEAGTSEENSASLTSNSPTSFVTKKAKSKKDKGNRR